MGVALIGNGGGLVSYAGDLGDFEQGEVVSFLFHSRDAEGEPSALGGTVLIQVYTNDGTAQSLAGVSFVTDFDGITGLNRMLIDTSASVAFYQPGREFDVVIFLGEVDSVNVPGEVIAHFSVEKRQGNAYELGQDVYFKFTTRDATGEPSLLDQAEGPPIQPDIAVYKMGLQESLTELDESSGLSISFDSVTGLNHVTIALDSAYEEGADYAVILRNNLRAVDEVPIAPKVLYNFSIAYRRWPVLLSEEGFTGYAEATPDAPSSGLSRFTFLLGGDQLPRQWWQRVRPDGGDVVVTKANGHRLPLDIIHFDKPTRFALFAFQYTGVYVDLPVRVWCGNPAAELLAAEDRYGQYNAYAAHVRAFYPDGGGDDRTRFENHLTMTGSPTVGGVAGPFAGALATDYDGSTQFGTANNSLLSADPFSLIGWGNSDSNTVGQTVIDIGDGSSASENQLMFRGDQTGDPIWIERDNAVLAATSVGYTVGQWHHAGGRSVSATSRFVYIDGGNEGTNTTNNSIGSITRYGVAHGRTGQFLFNGRLSLLSIHTADVGANWIAYSHAMGNQSAFWNGFTWHAKPARLVGSHMIESGITAGLIPEPEDES